MQHKTHSAQTLDTTQLKILEISLEGQIASSGPSYSINRLVKELIALQINIRLGGLSWRNSQEIEEAPSFATMFLCARAFSRLGASPTMRKWINNAVASNTANIIHCHSIWLMPPVYSSRAAFRQNIPFVVSPRGTLSKWAFESGSRLKPLFWKFLQMPALESVACFHATAEAEYEDIRRHGFRQPIAIIPNGVDLPPPCRMLNPNVKTLLFLSRIHPKKGIANLLHAWVVVQGLFPNWQLQIAGPDDGGYLKKMQTLASQLKLDRIEFTGEQTGANKWAAFARADLFVLPTHSENFGVCVAEALAAAVPTIVSKGAPWGQILVKRAGWWPEIGIDPLVECLKDAMSRSPEDLQRMGERGRQWMAEDFSWPAIAMGMANTYHWLLNGGPKPACVRID